MDDSSVYIPDLKARVVECEWKFEITILKKSKHVETHDNEIYLTLQKHNLIGLLESAAISRVYFCIVKVTFFFYLEIILHQLWVKKMFPWKFNLEYGGTFTKLFMHVDDSPVYFPDLKARVVECEWKFEITILKKSEHVETHDVVFLWNDMNINFYGNHAKHQYA
jgi:hypothetical protein